MTSQEVDAIKEALRANQHLGLLVRLGGSNPTTSQQMICLTILSVRWEKDEEVLQCVGGKFCATAGLKAEAVVRLVPLLPSTTEHLKN